MAAPYASGKLADAGARVVKVERPEGDFARGALTLIARGTVKLAADGFVRGKVNLEALKLEPLIDLLQEFQLISARDRAKWLFLGGLGAALGGNPQDRLSVPLIFKDGRTLLGPLDLGPSPRWR